MKTLIADNIMWHVFTHERMPCFLFGKTHAIWFDPANNRFNLSEQGRTVWHSVSPWECLDYASEIILDYCAKQFIPLWETEENHVIPQR